VEMLFAELPVFDGAYFVALCSRVLHIVGAIILVGGIAYLRKVVVPACHHEGDMAEQLYAGRRKTWAKWVGIATVLILASGIYNLIQIVALVVFFLAALLAGKTSAADSFRSSAKTWFSVCLAAGLAVVVLASVLRSLHPWAALPADAAEVAATEIAE